MMLSTLAKSFRQPREMLRNFPFLWAEQLHAVPVRLLVLLSFAGCLTAGSWLLDAGRWVVQLVVVWLAFPFGIFWIGARHDLVPDDEYTPVPSTVHWLAFCVRFPAMVTIVLIPPTFTELYFAKVRTTSQPELVTAINDMNLGAALCCVHAPSPRECASERGVFSESDLREMRKSGISVISHTEALTRISTCASNPPCLDAQASRLWRAALKYKDLSYERLRTRITTDFPRQSYARTRPTTALAACSRISHNDIVEVEAEIVALVRAKKMLGTPPHFTVAVYVDLVLLAAWAAVLCGIRPWSNDNFEGTLAVFLMLSGLGASLLIRSWIGILLGLSPLLVVYLTMLHVAFSRTWKHKPSFAFSFLGLFPLLFSVTLFLLDIIGRPLDVLQWVLRLGSLSSLVAHTLGFQHLRREAERIRARPPA